MERLVDFVGRCTVHVACRIQTVAIAVLAGDTVEYSTVSRQIRLQERGEMMYCPEISAQCCTITVNGIDCTEESFLEK